MKKRPFAPVQRSLIAALQRIFVEGKYADKTIESFLKSEKKWGARDRRQFAEATYDIVRWWRRLQVEAGNDIEKIVDYYFDQFDFASKDSRLSRAEMESIPDWLDELGTAELGDRWPEILHHLNRPAPVYLRVNTLRADRATVHAALSKEGIETEIVESLPSALRLKERANVFRTEAFKKGFFEMQDGASQMVAPLLDPEPGERIADTCAGAGGKTLHLAALMKNRGRILAMDIHQWKLDELKKRAARGGVDNVETRLIESSKTVKRLERQFDRVLMDVPCSGLGVLRRNPDTKWKLSLAELERLRALQSELLDRYSKLVKPGGVLVYATCSILPSENTHQVGVFLKRNVAFELADELILMPGNFDGFYAAKLRKL